MIRGLILAAIVVGAPLGGASAQDAAGGAEGSACQAVAARGNPIPGIVVKGGKCVEASAARAEGAPIKGVIVKGGHNPTAPARSVTGPVGTAKSINEKGVSSAK